MEGDRVFGLVGGGAYADQLVTHGRALARIPDHLSFQEAAATPEAFITAYDAMIDQGGLAAGETVLISAVGSGVGTAAVQLARAVGARSIGTARTPDKLQRAAQLGLTHGIAVHGGLFAERVKELTFGLGVDVVLELVGGAYLGENISCMALRGRIVLVGMLGGSRAVIDWNQVLARRLTVRGTVLRARPIEEKSPSPNRLLVTWCRCSPRAQSVPSSIGCGRSRKLPKRIRTWPVTRALEKSCSTAPRNPRRVHAGQRCTADKRPSRSRTAATLKQRYAPWVTLHCAGMFRV